MEENIDNFYGNLLAFWRPRKQTYYFLSWKPDANCWEHYNEEHTPFTLHSSTIHERGSVNIRIKSAGPRYYQTRIRCDGRFLLNGPLVIPIAKSAFATQAARIKREYTIVDNPTMPYLRPQLLWELVPAVPVPPKLAPIPRRIAWLVAEDACKKGETCPISTEYISPKTASVTSCFHVFDSQCINKWLEQHTTCPTCRETCVIQKAFDNLEDPVVEVP